MITALLAALMNSFEVIQSKRIMSKYKMSVHAMLAFGSAMIFFVMCVLMIFTGIPDLGALTAKHYILALLVILVGYIQNYFFYYSLKKGELCDVEPLAMMAPLVTMVMAVLIFPDERNYVVFVLGLVAALTLFLSRVKPHHFKMKKTTVAMLAFVFFVSIESNLLKIMLEAVPPIPLYTIRIGVLATLFLFFTKPDLKRISKNTFWQTLLLAIFVAIEFSTLYYSIQRFGVVETSLIMLLAPVLILVGSHYIFKEKMTPKKAISSAVILVCIAAAIIAT